MSKRHRAATYLANRDALMRAARSFRHAASYHRDPAGAPMRQSLMEQCRGAVDRARRANHMALAARRSKGGAA